MKFHNLYNTINLIVMINFVLESHSSFTFDPALKRLFYLNSELFTVKLRLI